MISDADYGNFMARVTYKLNGGNSALYFRAAEEDIPWVLKGFQNEIAGNNKDSALWHTQGKTTRGRGWVASNDELVGKVRDAKGGCANEMRFRKWEAMPVEPWMLEHIAR